MIKYKVIKNYVSSFDDCPWVVEEFSGQTINDIAPKNCVKCLVNSKGIPENEWHKPLKDGDFLVFYAQEGKGDAGFVLDVFNAVFLGDPFALVRLGSDIGGSLDRAQSIFENAVEKLDDFKDSLIPSFGGGFPGLPTNESGPAALTGQLPSNKSYDAVPIPLLYGEFESEFPIVYNRYSAGAEFKQRLRVLMLISQGEIESIGQYDSATCIANGGFSYGIDNLTGSDLPDGLKIFGIEASTLEDVTAYIRLGTSDQTSCACFRDACSGFPVRKQIDAGDVFEWTTKQPVHAIELYWAFPDGLRSFSRKSGDIAVLRVYLQIDVYDLQDNLVSRIYYECAAAQQGFVSFSHTIERQEIQTNPFETPAVFSGTGDPLDLDYYRITLKRAYAPGKPEKPWYETNDSRRMDRMEVLFVNELVYNPVSYRNLAYIALDFLSPRTSGGSIRAKAKGRKIKNVKTNNIEYSNNPADVAADLITGTESPLSQILKGVTLDGFDDWRDYCDAQIPKWTGNLDQENRCTFNFAFSSLDPAWDTIQKVARTGRANLVLSSKKVYAKLLNQRDPVSKVVERGNVIDLSITTIDPNDQPNYIDARFNDENLDYQEINSSPAVLGDAIPYNQGIRKSSITLTGCTRETQARRSAYLSLRISQRRIEKFNWSMPIEAISFQPGDVIVFEEELIGKVWTGRLESATSNSVTLDREVSLISDRVYVYTEWDPDDDTDTGKESVEFSVASNTTTNTISVTPPFGTSNAKGRVYTVKEVGIDKLIEVTGFQLNNDKTVNLESYNYDNTIYTDDSNTSDNSVVVSSPGTPPNNVTNLSASESWISTGKSEITLSWTDEPLAEYYDVFVRSVTAGNSWVNVAQTYDNSLVSFNTGFLGEQFEYSVVSVSGGGARKKPDDAAKVYVVILRDDYGQGIFDIPDDVTGGSFSSVDSYLDQISWDAVSGASGYFIRYGNWAGAPFEAYTPNTSLTLRKNNFIKSYEVRAFKNSFPDTGTIYPEPRVFSENSLRIVSTPSTIDTYTNEIIGPSYPDNDDFESGGIIVNGGLVDYYSGSFRRAVLCLDPETPLVYTSKVYDCGSIAPTVIFFDIRIQPWNLENISGLSLTSPFRNFFGPQHYKTMNTKITLMVSDDNVTYQEYPTAGSETGIFTTRYFKLKVESASVIPDSAKHPDSRGVFESKPIIYRLAMQAFRTP